jgi:acetyl-CoA synthetase
MRRLLKARELGLPEGDLSTVERPATGGATEVARTGTTEGEGRS